MPMSLEPPVTTATLPSSRKKSRAPLMELPSFQRCQSPWRRHHCASVLDKDAQAPRTLALHGLRPGVLRGANNIRLLKRRGRGVISKAPFGHMSIISVYCLTWEGRRPEPRGGYYGG